ncbi:hypothetical protein CMU89_18325 [Elizabethkingia anophelis]|uniref:hypothetical protein n=1 Tax=Elizabethkingia anophelis TaxID=1117645 RepID=UPI000C6D5C6C|nr:hypothetical protein [Elizabethkingia anophelis]MDV3508232.1 hypothetical protein [Elizabethkingia anophelis]MDV3544590.1 hypothetical protein [Elizabethkingia anophelis]PKR31533.1 hypothetical protein CWH99_12260 [Elizabethkingia anophelis]PKR34768.1 hypothetical protein CWI00_08730 [Elizabethkingia anophelis]PRQ80911.1 hypothetical protein CMT87_19060 [Elizabethkingia anophelis]
MNIKSYKSSERLNQTVLGESRVFIKENELAEIRKLIVDSGSEITEEELSGIITILDTIFRLAIKEFIIH